MTYVQLVHETLRLTPSEKFALVEYLLRDLRSAVETQPAPAPTPELSEAEKLKLVEELGGVLRPKEGNAPTDEDLRNDYTRYLIEKYLGKTL
jgi:hypothetical protein